MSNQPQQMSNQTHQMSNQSHQMSNQSHQMSNQPQMSLPPHPGPPPQQGQWQMQQSSTASHVQGVAAGFPNVHQMDPNLDQFSAPLAAGSFTSMMNSAPPPPRQPSHTATSASSPPNMLSTRELVVQSMNVNSHDAIELTNFSTPRSSTGGNRSQSTSRLNTPVTGLSGLGTPKTPKPTTPALPKLDLHESDDSSENV